MQRVIRIGQRALSLRIVRVAFAGAAGVIIQTIIFEVLGIWLGVVRPSTANIIGAEMGVLTAFIINNRYSFRDRSHAPLMSRLVRFHLVVSGSLFIQWLCVFAAEQVTRDWLMLHAAYALGIVLGFISNYTGYRLWVWRHHPTSDQPPSESRQ